MHSDTSRPGRFPDTRTSAVLGLKHVDTAVRSEAFGAIVSAYWKPVYKYVRSEARALLGVK